jgi:hypothetical protein
MLLSLHYPYIAAKYNQARLYYSLVDQLCPYFQTFFVGDSSQ